LISEDEEEEEKNKKPNLSKNEEKLDDRFSVFSIDSV